MGRPKKVAEPQINNYVEQPRWHRQTINIDNARIELTGKNSIDASIEADGVSVLFQNDDGCLIARKAAERIPYLERFNLIFKAMCANKDKIRETLKEADKSFIKLKKDIADYNTEKAQQKIEFSKAVLIAKLDKKKSDNLKVHGKKKSSLVRK